jgi:8-oxo-dGTP pyrophosphatase MutT (NUDIX family)
MIEFPRLCVELSLDDYVNTHPEETNRFDILRKQLLEGHDVQDRKNMVGHCTSSFMLLDDSRQNALMIFHNFLQKWLFPGGHYEDNVSLAVSATRELNEETGFPLESLILFCERHLLLDVDSHVIPANPAKSEGQHYHHDFLYLGTTSTDFKPTPQLEEVSEVKWVALEELAAYNDERIKRAATKALKLIKE